MIRIPGFLAIARVQLLVGKLLKKKRKRKKDKIENYLAGSAEGEHVITYV